MESCIHRAVRGEFIPASSFDFTPRRMLSTDRGMSWRDRVRRDGTSHICTVCACVAFALVILNIREDISILVGKHTNSCTAVHVVSSAPYAYTSSPCRCISLQSFWISRKGPRKMLSLRLLTSETWSFREGTNAIFQTIGKFDATSYIWLVDREISGLNQSVGKQRKKIYIVITHLRHLSCSLI